MIDAKHVSSASRVTFCNSSSTVSGSVLTTISASSASERRISRATVLPTPESVVSPTSSSAAP